MQPPPVWSQPVVMRSFDVDFRRQATLSTVCRWFLEAAWHDAERLGFGFADLARQEKLWVLSRLLVQVSSYPAWGETVEVRTWPRSSRGVFAMREFQMIQSGKDVCACGTSAWLVLDA
ncbi:acyl-ACP thioesterase, partial [bacterium]|nr:acyl-ACP thioesterase [bacterium]